MSVEKAISILQVADPDAQVLETQPVDQVRSMASYALK
jgi:hypothetical protein